MKKEQTIKILIAFVLITAAMWFAGAKIHAQSSGPQFLITWKAESYAPSQFRGKILPTANSPIYVSLEIVDSATHKLIDLTRQSVNWYVNDQFARGGLGVQNISFRAPDVPGGTIEVRMELPRFGNTFLFQTIEIPVVQPQAVIEAPYPGGNFQSSQVKVKGIPYFFNVANPLALIFAWNVNGETPPNSDNPADLTVNINSNAAPGSGLNIGLTIQNPLDNLDTASRNTTLTFSK